MARGGKPQKPVPAAKGAAKGGKAAAVAAPVRNIVLGAAVGIDFGSATVTLAAFKAGSFEAIVNTDGERYTPLVAGYANEVLLGSPAKAVQIKNIANTVSNVLRFLAKPYASLTEEDKQLIYAPIVQTEDGLVAFEVELKDTKTIVTPAQIISQFSAQLLKYAQQYWDCAMTSAVLSIPYDFSPAQTLALVEAVEKGGFSVLGSVNDPLAAAISFHLDQPNFNKINTYDNTPYAVSRLNAENVLVVDVGQNSVKTSIISVQQGLMKNFGTVATKGGSSEIDKLLFKHFVEQFKNENDTDMSSSTRAVSRLKQAVEQVKRSIAVAPTAGVQLDGLYQGLDLFSDISRRNFDELTTPFFDAFAKQLADTFEQFSKTISVKDISRVVLAGGSATLTNFTRVIQKYFTNAAGAVPQIMKHVNICDTIAFGAAKLASTYALELDQYTLEHPESAHHDEMYANEIVAAAKPTAAAPISGNSCVFTAYKHASHLSLSKSLYVKTFHGNFVTALSQVTAAPTVQFVPFFVAHPKKYFAAVPEGKTLMVQLYESAAQVPEHVTATNATEVASIALNREEIIAASGAEDKNVTVVLKFEISTEFEFTISVAYHTKGQVVPEWKEIAKLNALAQKPLPSSQYSTVLPALTLAQQQFDATERLVARIQYIVAKYQQWRVLPKHAKFIAKQSFISTFVDDVESFIKQHFMYIADQLPNPYNHKNLDKESNLKADKKIMDAVILEKLLNDFSVKLHDLLTFRKFTAREARDEFQRRLGNDKGDYDEEDEELMDDVDMELDADDDDIDLENDFDGMTLDDDDDLDIDMDFGCDLD